MGTLISAQRFEEAKQKRDNRRMSPVHRSITQAIERGDPYVLIDVEADAFVFPQHQREAMAHDLGMPKPPAPSISSLGGFLVNHEAEDEAEFPPPAC